ncbi:MAG: hypothetical protein ACJAS3_000623 [Roseivirga sp.]
MLLLTSFVGGSFYFIPQFLSLLPSANTILNTLHALALKFYFDGAYFF